MGTRIHQTLSLIFISLLIFGTSGSWQPAASLDTRSFTVGEKQGDFRMEPLAEASVEMMSVPLVKGVRIAADGWVVDPLRAIATALDQPGKKQAFPLKTPWIMQDIARTPDGIRWILLTSGADSRLARLDADQDPVTVTSAGMLSLDRQVFVRIVGATATRCWVLDGLGTQLLQVESSESLPKAVLTKRRVDPWGAAVDPDSGRMITLQANGGAVNMIIEHDDQLVPVFCRDFNCGETGELTLEAARPHGELLLSATGPGPEGIRRRFLRLDSLGAVHDMDSVRPHPVLRQLVFPGGEAMRLDFKPDREGWDVLTGRLTLQPLTPPPASAAARRIRVRHEGLPATVRPALNVATGQLSWLDGNSFCMDGKQYPLQLPETRRVLSPADGAAELFISGSGQPVLLDRSHLRLQWLNFRNRQAVITKTVILQPPRAGSSEVTLTRPWLDASGEIYLTDTGNFSLLHWDEHGKFIGSHPDLAAVTPGAPGEFFMISEGDEPGHKVLLHYDGDGNYLRLLAQLRPTGRSRRISGTRVLGRDKSGRVWWAWHDGKWRAEAVDYKTGRTLSRIDLAVPAGGRFFPETFRVSPEGTIFVARRTPGGSLELLELN